MGINWDNYPREKHAIKLQYLKLLKKLFQGETFSIRKEITDWALRKYPHLPRPKRQLGGSFDHRTEGSFVGEHGFEVSMKAIRRDSRREGLTEIEYINKLTEIVRSSSEIGG